LSILDYFNPALVARPDQRVALSAIEKAFNGGVRVFRADMPTGSGKTEVGMATARWKRQAVICTVQNTLLEAYRDLGAYPLKGKKNYDCDFFQVKSKDAGGCETAARVWDTGSNQPDEDDWKLIEEIRDSSVANKHTHAICEYLANKQIYVHSLLCRNYCAYRRVAQIASIVVTNYDYQIVSPFIRPLLVLDEGHHAGEKILDHVSITITRNDCEECKIPWPPFLSKPKSKIDINKALHWVRTDFHNAAHRHLSIFQDTLSTLDLNQRGRLLKFLNRLKEQLEKIKPLDENFFASTTDGGNLQFRPFDPSPYANKLLGESASVLVMSGTLNLKRVRWELGLPEEGSESEIRLDSPFPKENRPIEPQYVSCKMSRPKNISNSEFEALKRERMTEHIVPKVRELLERHRYHKGIIFTQSYGNANSLIEGLRDPRLLLHESDGESRKGVIKEHSQSREPTVIVTPSMTEGLDLKDDLGRFCIILKIPFGDLGNAYVKARADFKKSHDRGRYLDDMACTLMQQSGRCVRHGQDWAHTHVVDSCLRGHFAENHIKTQLLRKWWLNAWVNSPTIAVIPECDCSSCLNQRAEMAS
jgi:ATP-dependent DNA helicase DinG